MEYFATSKTDHGLRIEGFPDAVGAVRLAGPEAKRLADLSLHLTDLRFATECLDGINDAPTEPNVVREALWRSAIVHFAKCFGTSKSRFKLQPDQVYKGDALGIEVFRYFMDLRNRHVVHDENSYMQCVTGAVVNRVDAEVKIAKILTLDGRPVALRDTM